MPLQSYYYQSGEQAQFIDTQYFSENDVEFNTDSDFTLNAGDATFRLQSWADYVGNTTNENQIYGYYMIANVPDSPVDSVNQLAIAVYGNLKSITSQNVFGNLILTNVARYYTETDIEI